MQNSLPPWIVGLAAQAPGAGPPDRVRFAILTIAGAVGISLLLVALARRLRVPPLLLFLLGGLLVGPLGLHVIRPHDLGSLWPLLVALAVELVLFVAGLGLPPRSFRGTSWEVRGVLTSGIILTWGLTAAMLHLLHPAFSWRFCLLASSLVIATGPTIITPLLQRLRIRKALHRILYWESALTEPVGAVLALISFALVAVPANATAPAYGTLALQLATGILVGGIAAGVLASLLRRRWLSAETAPIVLLAGAIVIPAAGDLLVPDSGLLSAIVAGLTLGRQDLPAVHALRRNRVLLMQMVAGPLLVLIAATLTPAHLLALGRHGVLTVLGVVLIVRPLNIFLSTAGGQLQTRDKLFLSWIAPRGVLTVALAALFALQLPTLRPEHAEAARFLESFAFAVILGTVLLQGLLARRVGQMLGVLEAAPTGWLIAGAHALARETAMFIRDRGAHVVLVDADEQDIVAARRERLPALQQAVLTIDLDADPEFYGIGHALIITEAPDLNERVCRRLADAHPELKLYRWSPTPSGPHAGDDHRADSGIPVWPILRPGNFAQVGSGAGSPLLERVTARVCEIRHPERILLAAHEGGLTPDLPADPNTRVACLVYQPMTVGLDLNVRPEWIVYSRSTSFPELLGELLERLRGTFPALNVEDVRRNLIRQEGEYSSLVGYDVALPHFHLEQLEQSVVLAAKLEHPLTDAHSGGLIRLVFLVLSPSSQPRTHLQALAEISKFIMDADNRARLDAATDAAALHHIFCPRGTPPCTEAVN